MVTNKLNIKNFIQAKNIHKYFRLSKHNTEKVLNGVDLDINFGEFVALMGQSGSGKSTLLYILGLLDNTSKGHVTINNENMSRLNSVDKTNIRLKHMGYIFQDYHLIPELNLVENLMIIGVAHTKNREQSEIKAKKLLIQVGLKNYMYKKPTELSGGQQQRVAIARSLINDPLILFADEPTANLDSKNSKEIMDLFSQLNKERQLTIVMVTHETCFNNYFSRIINLKDGIVEK